MKNIPKTKNIILLKRVICLNRRKYEKCILSISWQVNSYPHIGTLTNFISAFALAKHFKKYFKVPVKIKVELLESATGEEKKIDGIKYYKNLKNTKIDDEKSIVDKYLSYFIEILEKLSQKDNVEYEILFFYEYQKDPLVRKSLIEVINQYDLLNKILYLLKCDKRDNSLNVIVDGGDWSGM